MKQVIPIICKDKVSFFYYYLKILELPINNAFSLLTKNKVEMSDNEQKLLSQLLYYNNEYRDIKDTNERMQKIFDHDTAVKVREFLHWTEDSNNYHVYLKRLMDKGVILGKRKTRVIHPGLEVFINNIYKQVFEFKIVNYEI